MKLALVLGNYAQYPKTSIQQFPYRAWLELGPFIVIATEMTRNYLFLTKWSLKKQLNNLVDIMARFMPFDQLSFGGLYVHFGVVHKVAVPLLVGTSFTNRFINRYLHCRALHFPLPISSSAHYIGMYATFEPSGCTTAWTRNWGQCSRSEVQQRKNTWFSELWTMFLFCHLKVSFCDITTIIRQICIAPPANLTCNRTILQASELVKELPTSPAPIYRNLCKTWKHPRRQVSGDWSYMMQIIVRFYQSWNIPSEK